MKPLIQSQKNWNDFKTAGRVGIITTLFSEQFLEANFETFNLTPEDYQEEIELNSIDTVFIDNDLFETDHNWYRKNRGHLINYLKNNNKNICVIKNTTNDVAQIFKKAFVMIVNPEKNDYLYTDNLVEIPVLIDQYKYNPIDTSHTRDITYFNIGKTNSSFENRTYNQQRKLKVNSVSDNKVTRDVFVRLFEQVKNSKIVYINQSSLLDAITLKYIECISYLYTTYVVFDHHFEIEEPYIEIDEFNVLSNKISMYLNNPNYLSKHIHGLQRCIMINNTFSLKESFEEFLKLKSVGNIIPQISVITSTNRKNNLNSYLRQINLQKHVNLEINIVTHGFKLTIDEIEKIKRECNFKINLVSAESHENLGACLNKAIDVSNYPVITKIDDDDYYLDYYIIDQWLALNYSNAELVGKSECYYYFEDKGIIALRNIGEHYKFSEFIMGATIMTSSKTMKTLKFDDIPKAVDTNFIRRLRENDGKVYIGSPYEMCVYRSNNSSDHTWQVSDLAMLKNAKIVGYGNPIPYIQGY